MKNEKITETSKKFDFVSRKFSLFTSDFFLFEVCKRLSNQSYYDSTDFRYKFGSIRNQAVCIDLQIIYHESGNDTFWSFLKIQ